MTNEAQYLELMSKYLSGNIAPAERRQLLSWAEESPANQAFFDEMIELWSISDAYEEPELEVDAAAAWARLEPRLDQVTQEDLEDSKMPGGDTDKSADDTTFEQQRGGGHQPKVIPLRPKRRQLWRRIAAVAAIIILSTVAIYQVFMPTAYQEIITQTDERQEVLLPDGTKVLLNQSSTLTYNTRFKQRNVQLEGEAFFEVAPMPSRPFRITSGEVVTTVLGTAFNVRAYPQEKKVEVAVQEGRVQVEASSEQTTQAPVQLSPGEAVRYDRQAQALEPAEVEIENITVWKSTSLAFEDEAFTDIASRLERYFNVEIELDENKYSKCPFTIDKIVRPKLEDIFLILEGLDFEIEELGPGQYRISGGMCD
jgi:ferric-dicitrate binding protein FerR (iron transport regulator)